MIFASSSVQEAYRREQWMPRPNAHSQRALPQAARPVSAASARGPSSSLCGIAHLVQRTREPAHRRLIPRIRLDRANKKAPCAFEVAAREQHCAELTQRVRVSRLQLGSARRFVERGGHVSTLTRQTREIDVRECTL